LRSASFIRARVTKLIGLTLIVWSSAWADAPWREKPFREWDRADVRRILYDSPWVKHSVRTKRDLDFEVPDQGPSGMELRGYHAKESKDDGAVTTEFYVRWVSSRTVRLAWARRQAGFTQSSSPGKEPLSNLNEFEVAVAGRDMSTFDGVKEAALKKKCFLSPSSLGQRIAPSGVEIARSPEGKTRGLLFHFPRRTATGEPTISAHEARVGFIEYAGYIEIRVTFYPQTMVDREGLDL
jgi:hypothetical protein